MADLALVTGATGFIGRNLVDALHREGYAVRAMVRPESAPKTATLPGNTEVMQGELFDKDFLGIVLGGVDVIFHLAGRLYVHGTSEHEYEKLHVEGTRSLLEACLAVGSLRRIVHCSTTGVLGPTDSLPASEDAPQRPSNAYERTKALGEELAKRFYQKDGLPISIARPALVYGPGDLHLLGWFRAIQRGYYHVVGSGNNRLHPIFIDNLVDGLLLMAKLPAAIGRVYHLAGTRSVSIQELAFLISQKFGRRLPPWRVPVHLARGVAMLLEALPWVPPAYLPLTRSRIDFMTQSRVYSCARAETELGFKPGIDLDVGLERTIAWYRSEGLL